ncbi:MAG TPA: serine/threonine-protein kinase [Vicinamibacterales bacterium]
MSSPDEDLTFDPVAGPSAFDSAQAREGGHHEMGPPKGGHDDQGGHFDSLGVTSAATVGTQTAAPATSRPTGFAPGAIIAGRYRLVALLGRGGMGEVYRADDLTLDQPVALKFLPSMVADGDTRLSQFHNELRVARQVSHKNVCRLYDLGEAQGRRFLTMEYVDGEDLGSLLRRIGRIPHDKAVQIARQLCAGVAAAHERGVLHRDLKPANVMIDGDGNVRITDFGIATAAGEAANEFAGTLQYMAPEQFAGKGASIKSDVYALGLTLYEIFTGKRAQDSKTLDELKKFHEHGTHTTPSSIVRDLDPAVERVILRCLDRDPDRRPASALVVAAALPGADPLAAALAAGETPSPEILAAAGEADALGVRHGLTAVALIVAGLLAFANLSPRSSIVGRVPIDKPAAVLIDKANALVTSLGYTDPIGDRAYRFVQAEDYVEWIRGTRRDVNRWDVLSSGTPSAVRFWYRTSPRDMRPLARGAVTLTDPPLTETGQRLVTMDGAGRLMEFRSVPPQYEKEDTAPVAPSWDALFAAAGLQMSAFSPVTPQWTPRDYADVRSAWEGPLPGNPGIMLRVEAGVYRGKPVSFLVTGPWTRPSLMIVPRRATADTMAAWILVSVIGALLAAAALLAWRNIKADRADRQGAARLALFIGGSVLASWIVEAQHSTSRIDVEFTAFLNGLGDVALGAIGVWTMYVALEPYVRRFWPDSLLGWSRLLAGHIKDPRVGRDVLIGALFGAALGLVEMTKFAIIPGLGYPAPRPAFATRLEVLSGLGPLVNVWMEQTSNAVVSALLTVLVVVVLRLALKRNWLALPISVVLLSTSLNYIGGMGLWGLLFPIVGGLLMTLVTVRFGLLSLIVARLVWNVIYTVPMMPDMNHWSATAGNWTIALLVALTLWAFYASRAGQPLLGSLLKE